MIEVEFLLVERGEVGADGAEGGCVVESAEATGDLLFDFALRIACSAMLLVKGASRSGLPHSKR